MVSGTQNQEYHQLVGLVASHAYSILKVREIEHPTKGAVTLLKLRNPWGTEKWR
jgi:calpain-15